ncbi:hypothetical protein Angca_002521 [Angiostrongylus cantonensis]|nr:hypothetical protein Angca_002521 [Angiostrongylus cantonensis]
MLDVDKVNIQEIEVGSDVRGFCRQNSSNVVTLAAVDWTDTVVGVCALSSERVFLTLECFIKMEKSHRAPILDLLTTEAIKIARDRFPDSILIVNTNEHNTQEYEILGFITVPKSSESPRRLLFPPLHRRLKTIVADNSCSYSDSICDICELLHEIESLKYVPLVVLYRAMDARKVGLSIVRAFVRLAMGVQEIQREQRSTQQAKTSLSSKMSTIIENEAVLLSFAWEKLNTGHFSEVDDCWRLLFAAVSLVKSVRLSVAGQHLQAIAAADLGLLMGDCVPDQLLQRYAYFCDCCLPTPIPISEICKIFLAVPKPLQNSTSIPVFSELSKWDFVDQFLTRSKPVIIKGLISHWPAVKKWSFGYLYRILARRVVPVERGAKYTDSSWTQTLMTGSEFFRKCTLLESGKETLYLAQHRLFDQIPQLCDDFCLPLYCDHCDVLDRNCWIGPGGTISPLHTDPRENLFCQILGRKFFRLVSPVDTENVYAFKDGITTNTSQVDALNPNLDEYPDFAKAQCWDGVVESGDVLFIPKGPAMKSSFSTPQLVTLNAEKLLLPDGPAHEKKSSSGRNSDSISVKRALSAESSFISDGYWTPRETLNKYHFVRPHHATTVSAEELSVDQPSKESSMGSRMRFLSPPKKSPRSMQLPENDCSDVKFDYFDVMKMQLTRMSEDIKRLCSKIISSLQLRCRSDSASIRGVGGGGRECGTGDLAVPCSTGLS